MSDALMRDDTTAIRSTDDTAGLVIMPFYLIVDESYSMVNDIDQLNRSVADMIAAIQQDPVVDDLVKVSIISFSSAAQTVAPLDAPSAVTPPRFTANGGTNYGAAFREYHRAFEADRKALKAQGMKVYRPCVFFFTDGNPGDQDYRDTFRSLLAYNPETKSGNKAFPYLVAYGTRDATVPVLESLAYPDFGNARGRWFLSKSTDVGAALAAMAKALGNTVISSGRSVIRGTPQIVPPPAPAPGSDTQFGEAGDFVD